MSTNYVQTRWYRAPELLLNSPEVSAQTDVWSIGCIFAELLGGATMFRGTSPIDQIIRILNIMGTPDVSDVKGSQQGIDFMKRLKVYHPVDLAMKFPHASDNAIDLLKQMLAFNHEKRISAKEALKHPYFAEIYDPSHCIEGSKFDFSFESRITDTASIKRECYNTILEFRANLHPSCEHLEPLEPVAGEDWSVMSTLTKCWAGVLSYIK
jgi:serine/threonine protein kinase